MCERILAQNCQKFDNFNFEFSMSHHNAHYQPYKKAPDALPRRLESTTDCSFCFGILAVVTVEGERAEAYIIITHVLLFEIVILTLAIDGPAVI